MKSASPNHIILAPVITEKTLVDQSKGKYTFWVVKDASKNQIASSFKAVFGIDALSVNTDTRKGKLKTDWRKRREIQKPDRKKAVVTIKNDQKLEILSLNTGK